MKSSRRQRRDVSAVAAVEEEDLRIFVAEVLAGHEDQISGLTRAGRADDQRVADIRDVMHDTDRSRSAGDRQQ